MIHLLIATRNAHKVGEIQAVLGASCTCHAVTEFPGVPNVVENGETFAENATLKCVAVAEWFRRQSLPLTEHSQGTWFVLADDSGLEVDALRGAPGVHSARFAHAEGGGSGNAPDAENNTKLLRLLEGIPEERRTARFRCVLALLPADPSPSGPSPGAPLHFEGTCEGRIGFEKRGGGGFGYDPLFQPDGFGATLAELGAETKNRISHRARALEQLRIHLSQVMSRPSSPAAG